MPEIQSHKESSPVLLTPKEVAASLRVDLSTVYRWVHVGTIDAVQFGPSGYTVRIPAAAAGPKGKPEAAVVEARRHAARARPIGACELQRLASSPSKPPADEAAPPAVTSSEPARPCLSAWGDRPHRWLLPSLQGRRESPKPPSWKLDGTRLGRDLSEPAQAGADRGAVLLDLRLSRSPR
jgi:excisionase family DNA binding protein